MYLTTTVVAVVTAIFVATSVTVAPAGETASSNIPPMYEIKWDSNEPISPEAERAMNTFFVCEYSDRGRRAQENIRDAIGNMSFADESKRVERAEALYGLAKSYEQEGICRWSEHTGYVSGWRHNSDGIDLSQVPCTTLPNGICAYVQPIRSKWDDEVVYSLFTDEEADTILLEKEIFGRLQWPLIN